MAPSLVQSSHSVYVNYNNDGDDSDHHKGEDYDVIAQIPNVQVQGNDKLPRIGFIVHIKCPAVSNSSRFLMTM